ncbi:DUF4230 domain-containing protein [Metabacillus sp. Hm71]|uniref:DUF4230 domain-containing protein n=1 Tax=Metabacillus sp. Hm71 TaxID=3450743 RepID=UPI003F427DC2
MKWKFKQLLLKVAVTILALYIAATTYKAYIHDYREIEPGKIIKQHEQIADSHYIISEHMILGKLQSKSQIVSIEQSINKTDTKVDDGFLGERRTELTIHGTYKMGMNTKDIEIKHIDQETGTLHISLGKPILVSLDIPYDEIDFEKTQGFFRLAASDEEKKNFFKATKNNIINEIMNDKEIIKQAEMNNRDVVKEILTKIQGVNYIVFE